MVKTGSCNCGKVTVTVDQDFKEQTICHCISCRKSSLTARSGGSAFSVNVVVPADKIKIEGPTKTYTKTADSGNEVTREWCDNCGSAIVTKTPAFGGNVALKTSLFDDFPEMSMTGELYVKSRSKHLVDLHDAKQAMPTR